MACTETLATRTESKRSVESRPPFRLGYPTIVDHRHRRQPLYHLLPTRTCRDDRRVFQSRDVSRWTRATGKCGSVLRFFWFIFFLSRFWSICAVRVGFVFRLLCRSIAGLFVRGAVALVRYAPAAGLSVQVRNATLFFVFVLFFWSSH